MKQMLLLAISFAFFMQLSPQNPLMAQIIQCSAEAPSLIAPSGCWDTTKYFQHYPTDWTDTVKIVIHILRKSNQTVDYSPTITQSSLNSIFSIMKNTFEQNHIRIRMKLDSITYIDQDETYINVKNKTWNNIQVAAKNNFSNRVNIYCVPNGGTDFPRADIGGIYGCIWMTSDAFDIGVSNTANLFIHETGHLFGLFHVYETFNVSEFITRNLSLKNCYSAGDYCCDTRAHPKSPSGNDGAIYRPDCSLDSSGIAVLGLSDPTGQSYVTNLADSLRPQTNNYMSNNNYPCRTQFTTEQILIMRCHVKRWFSDTLFTQKVLNRSLNVSDIGDSVLVKLNNYMIPSVPNPQSRYRLANSGGFFFTTSPSPLDDINQFKNQVYPLKSIPYQSNTYRSITWQNNLQITNAELDFVYNKITDTTTNWNKSIAYFEVPSRTSSIKSSVDDLEASVNLHAGDPWLIRNSVTQFTKYVQIRERYNVGNYWRIRATPFEFTEGVFLGMEYATDTNRNNSFYRLRAAKGLRASSSYSFASGAFNPMASAPQTGDLIFLDWTTTPQYSNNTFYTIPQDTTATLDSKAIVFRGSNHFVTANYKSYLASTDLSPFSTNSQRHLCFDQGYYYLAYHSNNGLYLTKKWYSPQTTPWQVERKINFGFNGSYSMDVSGGKIFLTAAGVSGWKLIEYDNNVDAFSDTSSYASGHFENPVLAISMNNFVDTLLVSVAERKGTNSGLSIGVKRKEKFGSYPTLRIESFTQAGSSAINPSLVCDRNGKFHLAWEEAGQIFYQSFTVDSTTGIFAFTDATKARVSSCSGFRNGRKPSITVDNEMRANITWETDFYDVQTDTWTGNQSIPARNAIAYQRIEEKAPQQYPIFKFSNEYLFPVKNRMSHDPVIGGDKLWGMKKNIVWWSEESASSNVRSMHSVVANKIGQTTNFTIKQFGGSGYTPIVSLNNGYQHNAVYVKDSVTLGGTAIRSFEWTSDTSILGFTAAGSDSLVELRGAALSGASFTAGVAFAVFEDSLTGRDQPFRIVPDTVAIYSLADIPSIVQTIPFMASRLKFSIRRYAEGISAQPDPSVFDTATIEWYAQIRSIANDSLLLSLQLGRLAKNEAMSGVDSLFTTFPRQMVYVRLIAETSPSIINCIHTIQMFFPDTTITPQRWDQTLKDSPRGISKTIPSTITLDQNIPNPFTPTTEISYTLNGNESKEITLTVFDALGRAVMTLARGEHKPGRYSKVFDGSSLPSGTYIYTLRGDGNSITRRMTLVK